MDRGGRGEWVGIITPPQSAEEIARQGIRLTLTGLTNLWYRIERLPDLIRWGALATNRGAGTPVSVTDPESTNILRRFYRARIIPSP